MLGAEEIAKEKSNMVEEPIVAKETTEVEKSTSVGETATTKAEEPSTTAEEASTTAEEPSSTVKDSSSPKEEEVEEKDSSSPEEKDSSVAPEEKDSSTNLEEKNASTTPEKKDSEDSDAAKEKKPATSEGKTSPRKDKSSKDRKALVFPKFEVFVAPDKEASLVPSTKSKRRTSGSSASFVGNDPYRPPEMSPEITLIEFISSSAAYHGVKKQNMRQLEWDILKVFANNVMPANAAAWYMAKRRFYLDNAWEHQLLPFLLKKYPDKFYVQNQTVEFLEVSTKDVARKKMSFMVNQGLYAYFSHKADEYGVYFFDPSYYEHTEPFHANLRIASNLQTSPKSKLVTSFFSQYESSFVFKRHNPYLVSLSKMHTPIVVNTTGIIISMIDKNFGIIQFPSGSTTEKALFSNKSLFSDGWPYPNDPLQLDAIKFDGYRIPGPKVPGRDYTWYAVLVWAGRKPSPKFCATKDDLISSKLTAKQENIPFFTSVPTSPTSKSPSKSGPDEGMIIGEVVEIRKTGAMVTMRSKGTDEKALIMGWRHENLRRKGYFLTTTQGVSLSVKDLVGFYIDPNRKMEPYVAVAHQIIVLKHAEEAARPNMITHPLGLDVGSPNTRNGILRQLANMNPEHGSSSLVGQSSSIVAAREMDTWKLLKKMELADYNEEEDKTYKPDLRSMYSSRDSSDYDSFDEADEIDDGELSFLRDGIMDLIVQENKDANDWRLSFLQKIMQETNNLINTRSLQRGIMKGRPVTPSSSHDSGHATSAEVTPTGVSGRGKSGFWRMEKAFKDLETEDYKTDDDPTYDPSGSSDVSSSRTTRKSLRLRKESHGKNAGPPAGRLGGNWAETLASFAEIRYCVHTKKWIPNPDDSDDEADRTFSPREAQEVIAGSDDEIPEDELALLLEDASNEPQGVPEEPAPEGTPDSTTDAESPKKNKMRRRKQHVPLWIRFVGGQDNKPKEKGSEAANEEKEDEQVPTLDGGDDKKTMVELDDYNSDVDPEYIPPPPLDSDGDYDEYSDGEIGEEELNFLKEEGEVLLSRDFVGPCTCSESRRPKKTPKKEDCTKDIVAGKEVSLSETGEDKKDPSLKEEDSKEEGDTKKDEEDSSTPKEEKKEEAPLKEKDESTTKETCEALLGKKEEPPSKKDEGATTSKKDDSKETGGEGDSAHSSEEAS